MTLKNDQEPVQTLSAEEIGVLLTASRTIVIYFDNLTFTDTTIFNDRNYELSYLIFRNCIFEKTFSLNKRLLGDGIYFSSCTFKRDLILSGVITNGKNPILALHGPSIYLAACKIQGKMKVSGHLVGAFEITKTCSITELTIEDIETEGSFLIHKSQISSLSINKVVASSVKITENVLTDFSIDHLKSRCVQLITNTIESFYNHAPFYMCHCPGSVLIHNNTFNDFNLGIGKGSGGHIFIQENTIKKTAHLDIGAYDFNNVFKLPYNLKADISLYLDSNSCESAFVIGPRYRYTYYKLKLLSLSFSPLSKGLLSIEFLKTEKLIIQGANAATSIVIYSPVISDTLEFNRFINFGNLQLSNLNLSESANSLKIKNSNLGKTQLINCDLTTFKEVIFKDSNIAEIQYSAIKWFDESQLLTEESSKDPYPKRIYDGTWRDQTSEEVKAAVLIDRITRSTQLVDIYKQLKSSSEKTSDKNLTIKFRSLENKYYYERLTLTQPFFDRERLLMNLNRSNNFGTNWIKPIWISGVITGAAYFLIIISITLSTPNLFLCQFPAEFLRNFVSFSNALPQFFNPTHSLSNIFNDHQNGIRLNFMSQLIDLLQRVALSYLIFQTIVAFRKQSN